MHFRLYGNTSQTQVMVYYNPSSDDVAIILGMLTARF